MSKTIDDKVISFVDAKDKIISSKEKGDITTDREMTNEELVQNGIEMFKENLQPGAKGFMSIVFDADDTPIVVTAGDLDVFRTIGVLDYCKTELTNSFIYGNMVISDEFEDEDEND